MDEMSSGSSVSPASPSARREPAEGRRKGVPPQLWVSSTYFAEGFPYTLVNNIVEIMFEQLGASLQAIGLTSLFHLPWNLKFLWGPFLDQYETKRRWLVWMEEQGPCGTGSIPALRSINAQQPTAELRPPDRDQTDEGDLMPYEILDYIERKAIRDKLLPLEVFEHTVVEYPDHSKQQLGAWVIRFFQLFCRNQWKRERYAPSFHLDDESLDPKSWCRFPILSGGYRYEIQKLRSHLESVAE